MDISFQKLYTELIRYIFFYPTAFVIDKNGGLGIIMKAINLLKALTSGLFTETDVGTG